MSENDLGMHLSEGVYLCNFIIYTRYDHAVISELRYKHILFEEGRAQ